MSINPQCVYGCTEDQTLSKFERDHPVLYWMCVGLGFVIVWGISLWVLTFILSYEYGISSTSFPYYDDGSALTFQDSFAQGAENEKPDASSDRDER